MSTRQDILEERVTGMEDRLGTLQEALEGMPDVIMRCLQKHQETIEQQQQRRQVTPATNTLHPDSAARSPLVYQTSLSPSPPSRNTTTWQQQQQQAQQQAQQQQQQQSQQHSVVPPPIYPRAVLGSSLSAHSGGSSSGFISTSERLSDRQPSGFTSDRQTSGFTSDRQTSGFTSDRQSSLSKTSEA